MSVAFTGILLYVSFFKQVIIKQVISWNISFRFPELLLNPNVIFYFSFKHPLNLLFRFFIKHFPLTFTEFPNFAFSSSDRFYCGFIFIILIIWFTLHTFISFFMKWRENSISLFKLDNSFLVSFLWLALIRSFLMYTDIY